ncbi:MAG: HEAT repeat domain-containing protein [Leptolyngbyaceae cyanobacterium RU_5_1]|nr:HEAT repeat domain-containing protein [Leptolyngbyaceae cyanobacterium RU_5_1]
MDITPESVEALLNSSDLGDRLKAMNQTRMLEPAAAFKLARQAVNDSNPRIRYSAVSQLATLGQHNLALALTILRGRLKDSEPDVQAAAADSIAALQLTEAFEDLQTLYISSPEWLVKFSIIAALGTLGDERGFALLEDALQSPNELTQMAAIGSLGELGDERAIPLLIPYAANPDWQVRYRVAQALAHFKAPEARPTLEKLAEDEVEQVAQEAKSGLN